MHNAGQEIAYLLAELETATGRTYRHTWSLLRAMALSTSRDPLEYAMEWVAQRRYIL